MRDNREKQILNQAETRMMIMLNKDDLFIQFGNLLADLKAQDPTLDVHDKGTGKAKFRAIEEKWARFML